MSPMANVEGLILEIIKERANMNQPLTPSEGLQLKNSLIDGQEIQLKIMRFHKYKVMFNFMTPEEQKGNWIP